MGWLSKLSDEEIEQVLGGEYAGEDAALDDLAAFARDSKAAFGGAPGEATRVAHLAAMAEAAADLEGEPLVSHTPAAPRSPLRRMKPVLASLFATLTAKLVFASVALAATTGGLAATGSLPEPAQEALAKAAEKAGFELPAGDDETDEEDGEGIPEELPEQTEGSPAQAVLDVIRNWADEKGCEFGHAVAEAAGGNPGPCRDEADDSDEDADSEEDGKAEGRPEGAGKPEGTPDGKPDGAGEGGKPEGTPDGKPEGAGTPEGTPGGHPDTAGPPEGTPSGGGGGDDSGGAPGGQGTSGGGMPDSVPGGKP